jgi:two-component system phosphate regulon sensor histidine kinase PhoR
MRLFPQRFFWRLTLGLSFCLIFAMILSGFFLTRSLRARLVEELTEGQTTQARIMGIQLDREFIFENSAYLQAKAKKLGENCLCRVTLMALDGVVLADSNLSFDQLPGVENHRGRPEVAKALKDTEGSAVRRSATIGVDLLYTATPFYMDGKINGVVRTALPLTQVEKKVASLRGTVFGVTAIILGLAILMGLWLSRSFNRPVQEMSEVAERLAQGDYEARVLSLGSDEHGQLGKTINFLADRVKKTVEELSREKAQLSTVLSNMVEAVLAVDGSRNVLVMNPMFSRLFQVQPSEVMGKPFFEIFRSSELGQLLNVCLETKQSQSGTVQMSSPEERAFEAQAVPLIQDGASVGALLVLHDITRVRQLEQVRKDFVANVSHELRTPLASVKGYAETLKSGVKDKKSRDEFLQTIERHADNMTRLVEDLLELSSIESGRRVPELKPLAIMDLIRDVVGSLIPLADHRKVTVEIKGNSLPPIKGDETQIKQVLTNLIDNAIKFNRENGRVSVSGQVSGGGVEISVNDTGIGIPAQDQPRLFERFYRVDKARSREMGGTGLGLSIVKHIVEAHGGRVRMESVEGEGSTFRFFIPY